MIQKIHNKRRGRPKLQQPAEWVSRQNDYIKLNNSQLYSKCKFPAASVSHDLKSHSTLQELQKWDILPTRFITTCDPPFSIILKPLRHVIHKPTTSKEIVTKRLSQNSSAMNVSSECNQTSMVHHCEPLLT